MINSQLNYDLLIKSLQESIDSKYNTIASLKNEISELENEAQSLLNIRDHQSSSEIKKKERRFRWADMVLGAFAGLNKISYSGDIVDFIMQDRGHEIQQEFESSTYKHRIKAAIKRHCDYDNPKILLRVAGGMEDIYLMNNWIKGDVLQEQYWQKAKLSNIDLAAYGIKQNEVYDLNWKKVIKVFE